MNFTQIVQEVIGMTKRPDKIQNIRRAVNAAVLFYDTENDYRRDLQEFVYMLPTPGYGAIIPLSEFTRFRKMNYIKIGGTRIYVDELKSLQLTSGCDVRNKWYISGNAINASLGSHANTLDIAYYQYPPVLSDASPNFWMLEGNWDAILQKAAASVFNDIGDANSYQGAERAAKVAAAIFKGDYIRANQHG